MTTPTNAAANLVNDIRAKATDLQYLLARIDSYISDQHEHAKATDDIEEMQRLTDAEPFKWLDAAKVNLQTGIMFALRAVEQPTTF